MGMEDSPTQVGAIVLPLVAPYVFIMVSEEGHLCLCNEPQDSLNKK